MQIDLQTLWRHKITLAVCTILGIAVGVAYLLWVPPTYQAQARVLVEPQGVSPEMKGDRRFDPEFLPTQVETIRSPITIAEAIQSVTITRPRGEDDQEFDPVRHVLKSLSVTPVLNANVVTINYSSTNPDEALQIIQNIVNAYKHYVAKLDKDDSQTSTQVIADREKKLRDDLETVQKEYDELHRNSPLLARRGEKSYGLIELVQLSDQLAAARLKRKDLQVKVDSVSALLKSDSKQSVTRAIDAILPFTKSSEANAFREVRLQAQLAILEVAKLKITHGPRHTELIAAQSAADELQTILANVVHDVVQAWRLELKITKTIEEELEATYQTKHAEVKAADHYRVKHEILKGNLERLEKLHSATMDQLLKTQSTEKAINDGRRSIVVRILDGPVLLDRMTWPKPKLLLPAAAGCGFALGFFLVLLRTNRKHVDQMTPSSEKSPADQPSSPKEDRENARIANSEVNEGAAS